MPPRIRAAIVGAGFIGAVHAHAVRAAGGVVVATTGRTPEATARAVEVLGAERGVGSMAELAAADDVDVVHICTPNSTHAEMAEAVLAAGTPVICEKPLATSVEDARRLTARAAEADVLAAVPFVYRFYPAVREARARIAAGEAGPLWLLHGTYLQDWLAAADATNWRVDPALGGGSRAFGDIGVHWCDLMEFTTGHRIARLTARMFNAFAQRRGSSGMAAVGTEDGASVLFETDRGAAGSVLVSQASPGRKNRLCFSFDGPDAAYVFDQEFPDVLWIGGRTSNQLVPRGPDTLTAEASPYARLPAGHPQGYQDCFNAFVSDVYATIRGEKAEGLPVFTDGLRAAVLTAAVVESATKQSWVEVPT
jgi:predicted dehydrogenase